MTPLADAEARRLAVTEFARPILLEAGAGTGKTRTLVARLGTWLLGPGWRRAAGELAAERAARSEGGEPSADEIAARTADGVVAITFTDAAAAEMAARVGLLLGAVAAGSTAHDLERLPDDLDAAAAAGRAAALLTVAARLRISTIHGFCHRLISEHPLEAGVHPGFRIDAEGELSEALATRILLGHLRAGDPALVALLADGVDPPQLLAVLCELAAAGVRPEELARDPFDRAALEPLFAELGRALDAVIAFAPALAPARRRVKSIDEGLAALARLRSALAEAAPTADGLESLSGALAETTEDAGKILGGWAAGKLGKTEAEALGADSVPLVRAATALAEAHDALAGLDPARWTRITDALAPLLAELRARLRAEGVVSFEDLLARAVALVSRPAARARIRRGMTQLLVDEFQDTDRRQCDLLRRLVLDDPAAPRPALFVVGDPQQSIYGWRSADLAAYFEFVRELGGAGAVSGRLDVNFRSVPAVLDEVARALAPVLVEEEGRQAAFQPLRACPQRADDPGFVALGRAPVEFWSSLDSALATAGQPTAAGRATEIEAEAIARDVRELVRAGAARWSDFAVLLRARGDLEVFLDALRRAGVPYVVQKDRSYYRRREVIDVAAAVRSLLDPVDLLALVAFLRSPFVGVPDAAWLPLWRAGFPAAMVELGDPSGVARVAECVATAAREVPAPEAGGSALPGWSDSLLEAVDAIARLRDELPRLPASEWVERLRARLLLEPVAAARYLGRFGLANLERLLSQIETLLVAEPDPGRALAQLRRAVAEEIHAEEARPPEGDAEAVSLMTIHTAKGLQFRHVYVVQAARLPSGGGTAVPDCDMGPAGAARALALFGTPNPGWRALAAERARVARAETARVLYVALTRAQDRLVVSGAWDTARAGRAAPSFADLLAERLDGDRFPAAGDPARHDEHGVVWRLADAVGTAPAVDGEIAPPPPLSAARPPLTADLDAARRRSARPRVDRITDLARRRGEGGAHAPARAPVGGEPVPALGAAFGTAIHRALERLPTAGATAEEIARAAHELAPPGIEARALAAALARLLDGPLGELRRRLGGHELARELPLLLRPPADHHDEPTDALVGTLDLLYRDPGTGETVVADFKSDALAGEGEIAEKLARYAPQLRLYGRAVELALGLPAPPRLELWLLSLDRVLTVPDRDSG